MFMKEVVTAVTKAMQETFDADYPEADFQDLHVSIEYPDDRAQYPCIWVDFDLSQSIRTVGIGHTEWAEGDTPGTKRQVKRWRFSGRAMYTVAALTNLERARLMDEVIRVLAFGKAEPGRSAYRDAIEDNPYIAMSGKFDEINVGGMSNAPGTPWGTDDMIYEVTLSLDIIGEFVSDPNADGGALELVPLSAVTITEYLDTDGVPEDQDPWL